MTELFNMEAETQADLLVGRGETVLIFEGDNFPLSLILVCLLRGFEVHRKDMLTRDLYQTQESLHLDGDAMGRGKSSWGFNGCCGVGTSSGEGFGRGNGLGREFAASTDGDGDGKGVSPLSGSSIRRIRDIEIFSVSLVSDPIYPFPVKTVGDIHYES